MKTFTERKTESSANVAQLTGDVRTGAGDAGQLAKALNRSPRVQDQNRQTRILNGSQGTTSQTKLAAALANRPVQRMCRACAVEEEPVQTKSENSTTGAVAQLESANRTGLPDSLKSGVETMSGLSMDDVRVHYNSDKPAQLQAHAYTQGSDIHVAPGQEQHLPHEAWHVVQQKQGRVAPTAKLRGVALNDDNSLEKEADTMGARAVQRVAGTSGANSNTPLLHPAVTKPVSKSGGGHQPVQRTRAQAFEALGTNEESELWMFIMNTYIPSNERRELIALNNANLTEGSPDFINPTVLDAFPDYVPKTFGGNENVTGKASKNSNSSALIKRKIVPKADKEKEKGKESPEQERKRRRTLTTKRPSEKKQTSNSPQVGSPEQERFLFPDSPFRSTTFGTNQTPTSKQESPSRWRNDPFPAYRYHSNQEGTEEYTPESGWRSLLASTGLVVETQPPTQLGVATWNVAHFSDVDLGLALHTFQSQFDSFSSDNWSALFKQIDAFLATVTEKIKSFQVTPTTVETQPRERANTPYSLRAPKVKERSGFEDDYTLREEHGDIFKGLQGNVNDKLRNLSGLLDHLRDAISEIDVDELSDQIGTISDIDWETEWKSSRRPMERAAFADQIKKLRKFEAYAQPAEKILMAVQKIKSSSDLQVLLDRLPGTDYDGLLSSLNNVAGTLPKVQTIYQLGRALHSFNIRTHVDELFESNQWLDLLTLQEVNNPELLRNSEQYDLHRGPELQSGGKNPQHEFYPLLTRKDAHIRVDKVFTVKTNGTTREVEHGEKVDWDKGKKDFRPIVVYEIRRGTQTKPTWIGVVHTTPESDSSGEVAEFNRREIFAEIEKSLAVLRAKAKEEGIPLIIGGDYYLTAEAVVKNDSGGSVEDSQPADDLELTQCRNRITRLKNILEYQLHIEKQKTGEFKVGEFRSRIPTDEELAEISTQNQKIQEVDREESLIKVLNERIKFLDQALRSEQLLRNLNRLTVKKQVDKLGLLIAQTVSGTNPKKDPLGRWFDLQIADFFIHNEQWKSAEVGLLHPLGKLLTVDTENRDYSRYWQHFSDHFPVGGVFSLNQENLKEHQAFVQPAATGQDALWINILRYAGSQFDREVPASSPELHRFRSKLDLVRQRLELFEGNPLVPVQELEEMKRAYRESEEEYERRAKHEEESRRAVKNLKVGSSEVFGLAGKFLKDRYQSLQSNPFAPAPQNIPEYIAAIQELEQRHSIPAPQRLHVTTPADFEPNYKEK